MWKRQRNEIQRILIMVAALAVLLGLGLACQVRLAEEMPVARAASTYYVNHESGDNENPGTAGEPWETIAYGITQMSAGDTLVLQATTADWTEVVNPSVSGSSGSPYILQGEEGMTVSGNSWRFNGVSYWTLKNLHFESFPQQMIIVGETVTTTHLTIDSCSFFYATTVALQLERITDSTITGCHFRDIRSRSAGVDRNAVQFRIGADHVLVEKSDFEDIGSDGIHVLPNGPQVSQVENLTFLLNHFWVNRPYGEKSWQDFSTNVGENGIDVKYAAGPITITKNVFNGFEATVAGQDASGSNGEAILAHYYVSAVTVTNNIMDSNDRGIGWGPTGAGCTIQNNIICDSADTAFVSNNQTQTITINQNELMHNAKYLILNSSVITFTNNLVHGGSYTRGSGNTEEFTSNRWVAVDSGPPTEWQDAGDTFTMDERTIHHMSVMNGFTIENGELSVSFSTAELTGMNDASSFVQWAANSMPDITVTATISSIGVVY